MMFMSDYDIDNATCRFNPTTATAMLKRALPPIKAFYTKHPTIPRPEVLK